MNPPAWKGRFVVLEGIDGSGTTTQAALAARSLRSDGLTVWETREPSDGPIGTLIRQALKGRLGLPAFTGGLTERTLALMFAADRLDHLEAEILPALRRGEVVICDRYLLSSLAYQGATCPIGWVEEINAGAITPDLTLFLDVQPETAAHRRAGRGGLPEIFEGADRQRRVSRQYAVAIRRLQKRERIVRIAGDRPPEEVAADVLNAIRKNLPKAARVALR
jgi:dTMP kinase